MNFTTPTRASDNTTPKKVRPLVLPQEETTPVPTSTTPTSDLDLWDDWPIRRGYALYTLEDVALQESVENLERWLELFSPSSQPRSEEEGFYILQMYCAIEAKLELLRRHS